MKAGVYQNTDEAVAMMLTAAKDRRLVAAGAKVAVMHANGEESPSEETVIKFVDV